MSKNSLALVSLIAAIPALALTILLSIALLSYFGSMPGAMVGLVIVAWLASFFTFVLPGGIMLYGGKGAAVKAPKEKKGKEEAAEAAAAASATVSDEVDVISSDEIVAEGEFEDASSEEDEDTGFVVAEPASQMSTGELDVVEGAFTEDNIPAFDEQVNDEFEVDAMDDFGVDEDEEKA